VASAAVASSQVTVDSVLASLRSPRFSAKKMFGEFAVYLDGKVVALVCDDRLYVKVHAATDALADACELAPPYPGAKDHYVLDEGQWASRQDLPQLLVKLAKELPAPKPKKKAR
jgi:TfoX/Sxy family transcriptional regulator of competence genes